MNEASLRGDWSYPTRIRFGVGRIAEVALACREVGIAAPLLVTDPNLAEHRMVHEVIHALRHAGLDPQVFCDLRPNPVGRDVESGVRAYKDGGHDGVIAFGGGSGLDVGKAIAFMSVQSRPLWDFEDIGDYWTRAVADGIAPVIAVPTTSGTGSEVGRAAAIIHEATHTKKIVFHPRMMPAQVICDPALVAGLPPHLTAATGMDALTHCLEAYCAPGFHPLADGIALEGLRLIHDALPVAFHNGADLTARAQLMAASAMGATAFQKGLGAIHALSHPVGAVYDAHHGLCNGVFAPYVLAFNRPAVEARLGRVAAYLGTKGRNFDGLLAWLLELRSELGIPHTADALGLQAERIEALATMAAADPTAAGNPIPVDAARLAGLYHASLEGQLPRV